MKFKPCHKVVCINEENQSCQAFKVELGKTYVVSSYHHLYDEQFVTLKECPFYSWFADRFKLERLQK